MAKATQNVVLSPSRDIPFNKLVLSQSNVRRIKAGVSVEELAEEGHPGRLGVVVGIVQVQQRVENQRNRSGRQLIAGIEQAARNAEQAVELGRELYQRLSVMTELRTRRLRRG